MYGPSGNDDRGNALKFYASVRLDIAAPARSRTATILRPHDWVKSSRTRWRRRSSRSSSTSCTAMGVSEGRRDPRPRRQGRLGGEVGRRFSYDSVRIARAARTPRLSQGKSGSGRSHRGRHPRQDRRGRRGADGWFGRRHRRSRGGIARGAAQRTDAHCARPPETGSCLRQEGPAGADHASAGPFRSVASAVTRLCRRPPSQPGMVVASRRRLGR